MKEPKCKVCGCTEDQACETPSGPCSWLIYGELCTACVVELKTAKINYLIEKQCRFCAHLVESEPWQGRRYWTCGKGRILAANATSWHFAWSGFWRPNKTVRAAQARCPHFEVCDRVLEVSRHGRPAEVKDAQN